jgi:hypothetical protein
MLNKIKDKIKLRLRFLEQKKIRFKDYSEYKDYFINEDNKSTWDSSAFSNIIEKNLIYKKDLNLVEIGVARGSTSKFTIEKLSDKIISYTGVDPYESNYDPTDGFSYYNQDLMDNLYKYVIEKVNDPRFKLIRKKSNIAHLDFVDNSIDAIYIDGNHSYEAVVEDIKYWFPKVKQHGLIIGDDILTFSGVKKAVKEIFSEYHEYENTWFVIK